jgi:hypothetical protein
MRRRDARRQRPVGHPARAQHARQHLSGEANLLVCPNLDAANILFNVLKTVAGSGVTIGPILLAPPRRLMSSRPRPPCAGWST